MRALLISSSIAVAVSLAACGKLDNATTVKDLRVLAVKSEPAGFLVDLTDPGDVPASDLQATVTALVADPMGGSQELTFSAKGCPDFIDTITAATGQGTKICPDASTTSQLPPPIGPALATVVIIPADMPQMADPQMANPIEYNPMLGFGLTPEQVRLFFSPMTTGVASLDQSIAYNRDFGVDAIVDATFDLGTEHAEAIKRLVYWPRLAADQQPNQNPTMDELQLYKHRNADTGDPEDPWTDDPPTLSIAAGDKLFVLPVPSAGAAEPYLLRVKNLDTMQIETQMIPRELLTYQFFATAGTFTPAERSSELSPILTSPDGRVHIDSEWQLPKATDMPAFGPVTIWVVVHDERAGTSWLSRTVNLQP
jgi:hypothetical protein